MTVSDDERLKLRAWAERRRKNYVGLALQMAKMDEDKKPDAAAVEISYNKLKRLREEFEEAKRVLTALD
jgi:hypothetical protein